MPLVKHFSRTHEVSIPKMMPMPVLLKLLKQQQAENGIQSQGSYHQSQNAPQQENTQIEVMSQPQQPHQQQQPITKLRLVQFVPQDSPSVQSTQSHHRLVQILPQDSASGQPEPKSQSRVVQIFPQDSQSVQPQPQFAQLVSQNEITPSVQSKEPQPILVKLLPSTQENGSENIRLVQIVQPDSQEAQPRTALLQLSPQDQRSEPAPQQTGRPILAQVEQQQENASPPQSQFLLQFDPQVQPEIPQMMHFEQSQQSAPEPPVLPPLLSAPTSQSNAPQSHNGQPSAQDNHQLLDLIEKILASHKAVNFANNEQSNDVPVDTTEVPAEQATTSNDQQNLEQEVASEQSVEHQASGGYSESFGPSSNGY